MFCLVAGAVYPTPDPPAVRVARYTRGGLPDTSFGGGDGLSDSLELPGPGNVAGGAVQGDGKIVLGLTREDGIAVTRFNADGSHDTAFGGDDGDDSLVGAAGDDVLTGGPGNATDWVALTAIGAPARWAWPRGRPG